MITSEVKALSFYKRAAWLLLLTMLIMPSYTEAQPLAKIRFGVSNAGVGNPPRIQQGALAIVQAHRHLEQEFEKDGIQIEWVFFKGQGPAVNEAFSNQQVDFATQGGLPSVVGRSVGLNTRIILVGTSRSNTYLAVKPDSGINGVKDLRGKRIAFHKGTATQLSVNRILEAHGLRERDVRIVNLDPQAAISAFLSGNLDAIFGTLALLRLEELGSARIAYTTKNDPIATSASHVLVHQSFAERHPDIVRRVVTTIARTSHWASLPENRDEVIRLWSVGSITEKMQRHDLEGVDLKVRLTPLFDDFANANDQRDIEDAKRFNLIRQPFSLEEWKDTRYLDQALKQLQLEEFWPRHDARGQPVSAESLASQ